MRLFIALAIPDDLTARLVSLQSGLPDAHWVAPNNFHLTLRFLGDTSRFQLHDLMAALDAIEAPAFGLTFDHLGVFASKDRVRALWVGVEPDEALNHLQAKVDRAAVQAGFPQEHRKFKPHVTLARFKGLHRDRVDPYLARQAPTIDGEMSVAAFHLYRSYLTKSGPDYERLQTFPLVDYAALWPEEL